jgi:hypothetical protein
MDGYDCRMRWIRPALVVAVMLVAADRVWAAPYTVEDLSALARGQQWDELLAHADEIPSDKRGPAWRDLVDRAAMALVNGASGGALGQLDVALSREGWSYAVPDGAFARKIKALIAQLSTPSTAWAAGDIAAKHRDSSIAVDFYVLAGGKIASHCADATFDGAVVGGLYSTPKDASATNAQKLATTCYDQLATQLRQELWSFQGDLDSNYFANVCGLLKSHRNLSGLQARECGQ